MLENFAKIIVFIILAIFCFKTSKVIYKSYFSPFSLYGGTWSFVLATYYFSIISYIKLSDITQFVIFSSLFSFLLGGIIPGFYFNIKRKKNLISLNNQKNFDIKKIKFFLLITSIFGFICILIFFIKILNSFGYRILYEGLEVRRELTVGGWTGAGVIGELGLGGFRTYGLAATYISSVFGGFYTAIKRHFYLFAYLPILNAFIYGIGYLGRSDFLNIIIIFFVSYYLGKKSISERIITRDFFPYAICSLVIIVMFLSIISYFRFGSYSKVEIYSDNKIPPIVIHYYRYLTNKIPALEVALTTYNDKFYMGLKTFFPLAILLYKFKFIDYLPDAYYVHDVVWVPVPSNTFTYLRPIYEDFGLIGVLIFPFLFGFISSYIQVKNIINPSLTKIYILSFLYLMAIFCFKLFVLTASLWIFIAFVLGILLSLLITNKIKIL